MKKKTAQLHIRLEPHEMEHLKELSKRCGLPASTIVRSLIAGYQPKEFPGTEFFKYMNMMSATANNINQIVARAHSYGYLDIQELEEEVSDLKELRKACMQKFFYSDGD